MRETAVYEQPRRIALFGWSTSGKLVHQRGKVGVELLQNAGGSSIATSQPASDIENCDA